jgi:hypothetical protein
MDLIALTFEAIDLRGCFAKEHREVMAYARGHEYKLSERLE